MSKITRIINGQLVDVNEHAPVIKPAETEARSSREDQKVRHRKDLLQKNEIEYWKANPEQAKELSPELRRLLS